MMRSLQLAGVDLYDYVCKYDVNNSVIYMYMWLLTTQHQEVPISLIYTIQSVVLHMNIMYSDLTTCVFNISALHLV